MRSTAHRDLGKLYPNCFYFKRPKNIDTAYAMWKEAFGFINSMMAKLTIANFLLFIIYVAFVSFLPCLILFVLPFCLCLSLVIYCCCLCFFVFFFFIFFCFVFVKSWYSHSLCYLLYFSVTVLFFVTLIYTLYYIFLFLLFFFFFLFRLFFLIFFFFVQHVLLLLFSINVLFTSILNFYPFFTY